jgi:hypothetical protein
MDLRAWGIRNLRRFINHELVEVKKGIVLNHGLLRFNLRATLRC